MIIYPSARVSIRINFDGDPDNYHLVEVLPRFAKVEINSYQQADEFEVKLDYSVFPIDPRTSKSCGIGIWIGTTKEVGQLVDNDPTTCLITGFVDDYDVRFEQEEQVITLKGRDFTGVLLDNKWFHGNIPLDMTLDNAIRWILDHDDAYQNVEVVNKTDSELPILANAKLRNYQDHTPDKEDSYWDIIYDLCSQAGVICYMKLDQLIIDKPKNLYSGSKLTTFIYGANLDSLRFRKKFGKNEGLNIEVRSYDTTSKTTISAMYPDPPIDKKQMVIPSFNNKLKNQSIHTKPAKKTSKSSNKKKVASGPAEHYEITTFVVNGISDIEQLKLIAESIWNQMYRKQIDGEFTTYDMVSLDTQSDLTQLRNGDGVIVSIGEQFTKVINNMPYEQKVDFLIDNGFNPKVAKEIAESNNKLDKVFYIQKARHEFDNNDGYTLSCDFVNYIEAPSGSDVNGS